MPKGQELHASDGDQKYSFKGSMGLAPKWLNEGLTPSEQRWVSACMLARTNYFGQPIEISMRSGKIDVEALNVSKKEEQEFTLFEGAFFGNIFLEQPVAYVCQGDTEVKDEILKWRICAQDSKNSLPTGEKLSMCDFIIVGKCNDHQSFKIKDVEYDEIIKTYLKPGLSGLIKR